MNGAHTAQKSGQTQEACLRKAPLRERHAGGQVQRDIGDSLRCGRILIAPLCRRCETVGSCLEPLRRHGLQLQNTGTPRPHFEQSARGEETPGDDPAAWRALAPAIAAALLPAQADTASATMALSADKPATLLPLMLIPTPIFQNSVLSRVR